MPSCQLSICRSIYIAVLAGLVLAMPTAAATEASRLVLVAIIDDGMTASTDTISGWNVLTKNSNTRPVGIHGTMVATVIRRAMASQLDSTNTTLRFMPIVAADATGRMTSEDVIAGIQYAVQHGAQIINLSLGGTNDYYTVAFNPAIQNAYDHGILIVVAAGNADDEQSAGNDLTSHRISPVCNDLDDNMVLGVGATRADGSLAPWSNVGRCVDVFAPGEYDTDGTIARNGSQKGTSFATAYVSGIAAAIRANYPGMSLAALRDRLLNTAHPYYGINRIQPDQAVHSPLTKLEINTLTYAFAGNDYTLSPTQSITHNQAKQLTKKIVSHKKQAARTKQAIKIPIRH